MKKRLILISLGVLVVSGLVFFPKKARALDLCPYTVKLDPNLPRRKNTVTVSGLPVGHDYQFVVYDRLLGYDHARETVDLEEVSGPGGEYQGELKAHYSVADDGTREYFLKQYGTKICKGEYTLPSLKCHANVIPHAIPAEEIKTRNIYVDFENVGELAYWKEGANPEKQGGYIYPEEHDIGTLAAYESVQEGRFSVIFPGGSVDWQIGNNKIILGDQWHDLFGSRKDVCETKLNVYLTGEPSPTPEPTGKPIVETDPCRPDKKQPKPDDYDKCQECIDPNKKNGTWTALGCIPNDPAEFVGWILARAVGIGGGIAFLLMLWGGFQIITSAGDPQKLNDGKDVLVSALAGLLFIIFSLFLLRIVGVDILELPGFNP